MAAILERPRVDVPSRRGVGHAVDWVVPAVIVVAVALRLPFLAHAPGADEAGYLMIGGQWHSGGTSLYGNYWVDRPPLLIGIFSLASALGGLVALRLIGVLAVAAIIAGSARSAGLIAGARASRWAALTAAALCTTPLLGTVAVNGELLAGPFVVGGVTAAIAALRTEGERRARTLAVLAGASALGALLIKQNFADVFVFMSVALVLAWHRREVDSRRFARLLGGFTVGILLCAYCLGLLTSVHGTSIRGVFDAMYPFRFEAMRTIASAGRQHATGRLDNLLIATVTSGLALLVVAILWSVAAKRLGSSATVAVLAMLLFDAVSIALGGNFWTHYLIQAIVPVAILTGVVVARHQPIGRPLVVLVAVAALLNWGVWLSAEKPPAAAQVGAAVAAAAAPGDTIVTAYGHAEADQISGLASPYQYLWSLPVKTLDPRLHDLDRVLTGPNAPTWFVTWNHVASWGLDSRDTAATIAADYHRFARICGHTVYLHNGLIRTQLRTTTCSNQPAIATTPKDERP